MRSFKRFFVVISLAVGFAVPMTARADSIKQGLFTFGVEMGGAEGVAVQFSGQPTNLHPGAMALIKRNLKWSADAADGLKWPSTEIKELLKNADRMTFADIESKMGGLRLGYQAYFAKEINPGAAAFFIMGVHESGAEGVAVRVKDFPRANKPGSGALIARNLKWMMDGAPGVGLTTSLLAGIQKMTAENAPFAMIAANLEKLRLDWQKELTAQPGFGGSGGGGAGTILSKMSGSLTKNDPKDRVRTQMYAKVYQTNFQANVTYVIDLESGNGVPGPNNPGFFDTWLRVEDASGRVIAQDDDGGEGLNSRSTFTVTQSGSHRIVVTSYAAGATGNFTVTVRQK